MKHAMQYIIMSTQTALKIDSAQLTYVQSSNTIFQKTTSSSACIYKINYTKTKHRQQNIPGMSIISFIILQHLQVQYYRINHPKIHRLRKIHYISVGEKKIWTRAQHSGGHSLNTENKKIEKWGREGGEELALLDLLSPSLT